jgi:glutamine cyclotransferase
MPKSESFEAEDTLAEPAEVVREYGPFPGSTQVAGVTYDGERVWFADKQKLRAMEPASGQLTRALDVPGDAGTAFDGKYLFQLSGGQIHKIEPATGRIVATISAPNDGPASGLAWAEGSLWVGEYRDRCIHQVDPDTGKVLRTIKSNRFVTGVTWVDGELWHGTWENEQSDIRRVDPASGRVLARLTMPEGLVVSGLESDGGDLFYAGGGNSSKIRAVRRKKSARK